MLDELDRIIRVFLGKALTCLVDAFVPKVRSWSTRNKPMVGLVALLLILLVVLPQSGGIFSVIGLLLAIAALTWLAVALVPQLQKWSTRNKPMFRHAALLFALLLVVFLPWSGEIYPVIGLLLPIAALAWLVISFVPEVRSWSTRNKPKVGLAVLLLLGLLLVLAVVPSLRDILISVIGVSYTIVALAWLVVEFAPETRRWSTSNYPVLSLITFLFGLLIVLVIALPRVDQPGLLLFSGAIFAVIAFGIGILIFPFIGCLWAPFAAVICARIARKRGIETRRFALAGALYSILFFWPWVYLVMRLRNGSVHAIAIRAFYFMIYSAWLIGSVFVWSVAVIVMSTTLGEIGWFGWHSRTSYALLVLATTINASIWFISLKRLRRHHKAQHSSGSSGQELLLNRRYTLPLVFALGWLGGGGVVYGSAVLRNLGES